MIRQCLFILISLGFITSISGQNFQGGAYAGLLTSQASSDGLNGFGFWGVHFGAYTNVTLGDNSDIKFELAFIQKGVRQVPEEDNNFVQYKFRAGYIEIPILYRFFWGDLSFEIGPALDINVSTFEESNGFETVPPPNLKRFNLAGIVGVNYHMNDSWYLNFRTNYSISPIIDSQGAPGTGPNIVLQNGVRFVVLSTGLVYEF